MRIFINRVAIGGYRRSAHLRGQSHVRAANTPYGARISHDLVDRLYHLSDEYLDLSCSPCYGCSGDRTPGDDEIAPRAARLCSILPPDLFLLPFHCWPECDCEPLPSAASAVESLFLGISPLARSVLALRASARYV